jgi:hypothetical protein
MDDVTYADFERLAKSHEELSAHVVALTAVVGAMATTSTIDYERLEECIHFAAMRLRPGRRPILLEKTSLILSDFEVMQKALRVEVRKIRSLKKPISKAK